MFLSFQDIRNLVIEHKDDCPDASITGKYILRWTENDDVDSGITKRLKKFKTEFPGTPVN